MSHSGLTTPPLKPRPGRGCLLHRVCVLFCWPAHAGSRRGRSPPTLNMFPASRMTLQMVSVAALLQLHSALHHATACRPTGVLWPLALRSDPLPPSWICPGLLRLLLDDFFGVGARAGSSFEYYFGVAPPMKSAEFHRVVSVPCIRDRGTLPGHCGDLLRHASKREAALLGLV